MNEEANSHLSAAQRAVLFEGVTEAPFSGEHLTRNEGGTYCCAACGAALFGSTSKFDSGCGWPAFSQPVSETSLTAAEDRSLGMERTEIVCGQCGGHLGHVFSDGPAPTGLRYCVNSLALAFSPEGGEDVVSGKGRRDDRDNRDGVE